MTQVWRPWMIVLQFLQMTSKQTEQGSEEGESWNSQPTGFFSGGFSFSTAAIEGSKQLRHTGQLSLPLTSFWQRPHTGLAQIEQVVRDATSGFSQQPAILEV